MERNAQAFDNTISWIETARENFDALGRIIKDVAEVLDITDLQDFDKALGSIPKPRDLVEWDNRIRELQKERALLKAQLTWKESELSVVDRKTDEALHLLFQFQAYIGQPGEIVTKARIFDKMVAKALLMTRAKVINIVVDYSSKMETLLVDLRKLMAGLHPVALQPRTLDLSEFPEIPAVEILHSLSTLTKATRTMTSSPILPADPCLDARTRPTDEQLLATSLLKIITRILEGPPVDPPLPSKPAPSNPPPPPIRFY